MSVTVESTPSARTAALDGIRGVAIVLVVLSHGWTLWPTDGYANNSLLWSLFSSGNAAVTIFFVVGGFLATRSLLTERERTRSLRVGVLFVRRFIRLSTTVYVLLAVVMFVVVFDTTDMYPRTETRTSVLRIATYTWNWYLQDKALVARPDLGHLWYLCVDIQVFVLLLLLVRFLGHRRQALLGVLAAITIAVILWRAHVFETEGAYVATLRTTTRMDGLIWGAMAATALPMLHRLAPHARALANTGLVLLPLAIYMVADVPSYFGWYGVALNLVLAAFVVGISLGRDPGRLGHALGWAPIRTLGRTSLAIFVWHYPIFWGVSRHSSEWHWGTRTAVAFALTAVAVIVTQLFVEKRVQRALASTKWRDRRRLIELPARTTGRRAVGRSGREN